MLGGKTFLPVVLLAFTKLSHAAVIQLHNSVTHTTGIPTVKAPSSLVSSSTAGTNVILSNDDGWAALNVRTFFSVLSEAPYNYNMLMSAPAENMSGRGGLDKKPKVLNKPCEFNTCPVGSPAVGVDKHNSEEAFLYDRVLSVLLWMIHRSNPLRQFISGYGDEVWDSGTCSECL
jgi:hypothetical protein